MKKVHLHKQLEPFDQQSFLNSDSDSSCYSESDETIYLVVVVPNRTWQAQPRALLSYADLVEMSVADPYELLTHDRVAADVTGRPFMDLDTGKYHHNHTAVSVLWSTLACAAGWCPVAPPVQSVSGSLQVSLRQATSSVRK